MSWIWSYLGTSIGKKQLVAVSGLLLVLFLIAHLAGNLLLFAGPEAFNDYAHKLTSTPLIYVAEAGLIAIFALHVGLAIRVTAENRAARGPVGYAVVRSRGGASRRSFASQSMIYTGALVFVFLVLHLYTFKFGQYIEVVQHGIVMRDLHALVIKAFRDPLYVGWYFVCMVVLGVHLHHAIASTFETFGLDHPKWTPLVLTGSKVLAWAIAVGFALIPVVVYLKPVQA